MAFSPLRKILLLFPFFIWVLLDSSALAEIETLFSPERSIKERLLKEVGSTTSTLELAIYGIISFNLAPSLLKAKQRGVKVRVFTDSKRAKTKSS